VFFRIMDEHVAAVGRASFSETATAAYEGHRTEEALMNGVSHYISGDLDALRRTITPLRARTIVEAAPIQRGRMLALLLALRGLSRLPHIAAVGRAFQRRWYASAPTSARA
jgi:hypothetical protein